MKARTLLATFLLLLTFGPASALAELGDLLRVFYPPAPDIGTLYFGWSIAASGNEVLIGSPAHATIGLGNVQRAGAAYLFNGATGELLRTFENPTPEGKDYFGESVAIAGNHVLVGAPRANGGAPQSGAAYLFDRTTGEVLRTFLDPAPIQSGDFASDVAIVGDTVVVGDIGGNSSPWPPGVAHFFNRTTGDLRFSISSPSPEPRDRFGGSLAAWDNNVLIGCFGPSKTGSYPVRLYHGSKGALLRTFSDPAPSDSSQFGCGIAVVGDNVAVGDEYGSPVWCSGVAYLFDGANGAVVQTFVNPRPVRADRFGYSVAAVGNDVLVGASAKYSVLHGTAHLFDSHTCEVKHTFESLAPAGSDYFSTCVAALGNNILIAAPADGTRGERDGAVYLFEGPVVPEPSTLVLLATGAVALLAFARRRRKMLNAEC